MTLISTANQKGGVGKTTTAINLSASLAVAEKNVLLIDLDPQANASSGLGIKIAKDTPSVYEVLLDLATAEEAITQFDKLKHFHIMPSHRKLAGLRAELVELDDWQYYLKRALEGIRDKYEYIIIDCPPALGVLTINALVASDSVLVPVQTEYYSLEGLGKLMATLVRIRDRYNPKLTIRGILLTMYDKRLNLSKQVETEIKNYFGKKVYRTIIHRNVRIAEAPGYELPILLYDAASRGAENYINLAEEILNEA